MKNIIFFPRKVILPMSNGVIIRTYDQIMYIFYDRPYCMLKLANERTLIPLNTTVKMMSNNLPVIFYTCNKSTIINLSFLSEYSSINKCLAIKMKDGASFVVTRERKKHFINYLIQINQSNTGCHNCTSYHNFKARGEFDPFSLSNGTIQTIS